MPRTMTAEREALYRKASGVAGYGDLLAELDAEVAAHQETQAKLDEVREALKYKQRGMTFTESERNVELVRQLAEAQAISRELLEALEESHTICGECYENPSIGAYAKPCRKATIIAKARGVLPEIKEKENK